MNTHTAALEALKAIPPSPEWPHLPMKVRAAIEVSIAALSAPAQDAQADETEAFEQWLTGPINGGTRYMSTIQKECAREGWMARAARTQPATPAPAPVDAAATVPDYSADLTKAKNLLIRIYNVHPATRSMIEAATGSWFVWGHDRDATPPAAPRAPESWEHLKPYGYAPGGYMSRCSTCGGTFVMDKRAITCKQCAEIHHARSLATPCDVPPAGWQCTRAKGHEGPCAATRTAPQAVPLTDAQRRDLVKESGLDWHRGYAPLFDGDDTNRFAVLIEAVERHHGISTTATKGQSK